MASINPKPLFTGGILSASVTVLYTCPANTKAFITAATFTNTDTSNQSFSVYIVRAGSGAGATTANILIDAQVLTTTQAYVSPELPGQALAAGDSIRASASASNVITCAGISGYELA